MGQIHSGTGRWEGGGLHLTHSWAAVDGLGLVQTEAIPKAALIYTQSFETGGGGRITLAKEEGEL